MSWIRNTGLNFLQRQIAYASFLQGYNDMPGWEPCGTSWRGWCEPRPGPWCPTPAPGSTSSSARPPSFASATPIYCKIWSNKVVSFFKVRWIKKHTKDILNYYFSFVVFHVLYSTLLHLPPLKFHCARGCWNRTQDCSDFGIGSSQTL